MFKKKSIRIAGTTTLYPDREHQYPQLAAALDIFVSYALLFLAAAGCTLVYGSVFPIDGSILALFLCMAVIEAALFPLYLIPVLKKYAPFLSLGVFLVLFVIFYAPILSGAKQCVNAFLCLFYDYYGIDLSFFPESANSPGNWAAVCFIMLIVLWRFIETLFYRKKLFLLFLPPLFLIGMELLVGMAPAELPLALTAIGCFGLLPYGNNGYRSRHGRTSAIRSKSALLLTAAILFCLFAADRLGREKAEFLASLQTEGLAFQGALEQQLSAYATADFSRGSSARVSNDAPQYEGKAVLSLTTDLLPQENLYLRGYVGDTYQNGTWTNKSKRAFASAMSDLSEDGRLRSGSYLLNLLYRTQAGEPDIAQADYDIHYLDVPEDYAYLPYLANLDDVWDADKAALTLPLAADAMIYRAGEERLFVSAAIPDHLLYRVKKGAFYEKDNAIEENYEAYLTQYLRVPDKLTRLRALGAQLTETLEQTALFSEEDCSLSQTREIAAAFLVCQELASRSSYSLSLDRVPFGTDTVEYFLFDSEKGFCEHYASAGVLLLREMGIPARYVTGYVVRPSDFTKDPNAEYTALVKDSAAHAWAEIYIKHVGWVPVEMTSDSIAETSAYASFYDAYAIQDTAIDSDEDTVPVADTQSADGAAAVNGTENTDSLSEPDFPEQTDRTPENNKYSGRFFRLFWILVCAVSLAGIFGFFASFYSERRRVRAFAQPDCRKAVQSIASYTYRLLWKKRILKMKNPDDGAYREAVKNALPMISAEELDAYFSVLERAAYSNEPVTKTDVERCYEIYRKIQ